MATTAEEIRRELAPLDGQGQLHGPFTLSVGPGTTAVPLDTWRMADTVPDRPSLPVTLRTPATDCQNAPLVYWRTATFGTSFVPSPDFHCGK
jgi:hypothetical protein